MYVKSRITNAGRIGTVFTRGERRRFDRLLYIYYIFVCARLIIMFAHSYRLYTLCRIYARTTRIEHNNITVSLYAPVAHALVQQYCRGTEHRLHATDFRKLLTSRYASTSAYTSARTRPPATVDAYGPRTCKKRTVFAMPEWWTVSHRPREMLPARRTLEPWVSTVFRKILPNTHGAELPQILGHARFPAFSTFYGKFRKLFRMK